jgi:asparagine synthase (glutamine-hydrolysing)
MTAIAGLVAAPPFRVAPRAADAMLETIGTPLSYTVSVWQEGQVSLGAQQITGVKAQHSDARFVVVMDSRLENRGELCSELGLRESQTSDAGLVASAFAAWGDACVQRLRGEFALALWDRLACELFCARDRFGVRPFYYRDTHKSFRFGSEAKALAPDVGLSSLALNEDWIVDFTAGLVTDAQSTAHAEICRLPPAHSLRLRNGEVVVERYWSFDSIARDTERVRIEALREAFIEAVRARLSGGTAAFLSGGLDSSSVCCVARDIRAAEGGHPLSTISIVFDETPEESERAPIEAVLATGRYAPRFINITRYRPLAALPRLTHVQDGPFLGPGVPLMDHAYDMAAREGFNSVLDGHGGDEVISSGMGRLHDLARTGAWGQLFWELSALGFRQGMNPLPLFAGYVGYHGRGLPARALRRLLRRRQRAAASAQGSTWLAESWREDERTRDRHHQHRRQSSQFFDSEQDYHRSVLSSPLQPYGFEVLSNISRHHGLESRFPFWDQSVVELCLRSPSSEKLSNGWPRALIRSAMKGIIPDSIRRRKDKLDFSGHMVRGLLEDKSVLLDLASSRNGEFERFISPTAFFENVEQLDHPDRATRAAAAKLVMRGAVLAIWLASRSSNARSNAQLEYQA